MFLRKENHHPPSLLKKRKKKKIHFKSSVNITFREKSRVYIIEKMIAIDRESTNDFLPRFSLLLLLLFLSTFRAFLHDARNACNFINPARIKVNPRTRARSFARSTFNRVFTVIGYTHGRNHGLSCIYTHIYTRWINISIRATCATACANPPFKSFLLEFTRTAQGGRRESCCWTLTREFLAWNRPVSGLERGRKRGGERERGCNLKKKEEKSFWRERKACGNFERINERKKREKTVYLCWFLRCWINAYFNFYRCLIEC